MDRICGELLIDAKLEKYVNYQIENQEEKTLVQYQIQIKRENKENYLPIRNSEIVARINRIDGKYPDEVRYIAKQENQDQIICQYDASTGTVVLKTNQPNEKDEFILLCYYDTYTQEEPQRNLMIEITAVATLESEEDKTINANKMLEQAAFAGPQAL